MLNVYISIKPIFINCGLIILEKVMGDESDNDEGSPETIIDELLCFMVNKWSVMDPETMIKLCSDFEENEIEASKDILFNKLHDETCSTKFIKRRAGKKNESTKESNLRDMYQLLQEKGTDELPSFVALDLGKLPPINFNHIDVTVLLKKIEGIAVNVKLLEKGMENLCDVNKSIVDINLSLEERISKLEAGNEDDNTSDIVNTDTDIDDCEKIIDDKCKEMPLPCTECDMRFKDMCELQQHIDTEHTLVDKNSVKYPCLGCEKVFKTEQELSRHEITHKPYACTECGFRCDSNILCQEHMATHTGEKPYSCSHCDFKCEKAALFESHNMVHKLIHAAPDLNINTCCVCEEEFYSMNELKEHLTIHTDNKTYACDECKYECTDSDMISKHKKKHKARYIEEKVYACTECKYSSKDYASLNKHLDVHKRRDSVSRRGGGAWQNENVHRRDSVTMRGVAWQNDEGHKTKRRDSASMSGGAWQNDEFTKKTNY